MKTFDGVTTAADFSETISNLVWGAAYNYAFRAAVPYNNETIEACTATNVFVVSGDIAWTAGAGTTDWHTADNWDPAVVPSDILTAKFGNVGGLVTASAAAAVSNIYVNTTGDGSTFDFGGNALTVDWLGVGYNVSGSCAVLSNGVFDVRTIRVGGSKENTLIVGDGADLRAGTAIYVGQDGDTTYASNRLVFARGSRTVSTGTLFLRAARDTMVDVEPGASLTVNRLEFFGCNDRMVVDGGTFTNNSATILLSSNNRGTLAETMFLELRNGANAKMNGNIYVNAGRNNNGEHYHAELRILSGSDFDATGHDMQIDSSSSTSSPGSDHGSGAAIIVSNATMTVNALSIAVDDRRYGDSLRIYEDSGQEARVTIGASCRLGSSSWTRSGKFNYDHRILVEGGSLSVGDKLHIGDGGAYYADHDNNRLEIRRANACVSANELLVYGESYVDFKIPAGGFDQVPLQVTSTASFAQVPEGAEEAVSEIHVDVTDFSGRQTLLTAASITGLTEDRVVVTVPKSKTAKVFITETSVAVTAMPTGTFIIIR